MKNVGLPVDNMLRIMIMDNMITVDNMIMWDLIETLYHNIMRPNLVLKFYAFFKDSANAL